VHTFYLFTPSIPRAADRAASGVDALQKLLAAGAPRQLSAIRSLPWRLARRSKKLPLRAKGLARTTSALSLPDTSGLAASSSATGSFTRRSRRERSNARRSDTTINGTFAGLKSYCRGPIAPAPVDAGWVCLKTNGMLRRKSPHPQTGRCRNQADRVETGFAVSPCDINRQGR